jgi:4-amino-4-deoxy-L-arabinose transferase-like glycosyltransferase
MYADRLDPWRGHWRFAWEMGMVGRSVATGKGFSSPFPPDTGATAWLGPVYPALIAGVFKVFGLFTAASAIALLALNSLFSALTCIPVFLIARKTMGERQARWAVWIWALFPYAIYLSAGRIWENALSALLLTALVWYTLVLEERGNTTLWAGYGALWALTALTNAGVCVLLPPLGLWIAWRRSREGKPWLRDATVSALVLAALVTPWEIRNEKTFQRFVPLRDNFWMEMRVGNTGDLSDIYPDWAHPGRSPRELELYQQLGETGYLGHMRDVATAFIRQYPGAFVSLCVRRFIYTWTGFWSTNPVFMKDEPFQFPNTFFCTSVTILALLGLRRMWRYRREWAGPYVIALVFFPLIYYITHPGIEYRHPIDPLIVILEAGAVVEFLRRPSPGKIGQSEPRNLARSASANT